MRPASNPLWRQWELDPPVFTVDEVTRQWKTQLEVFHRAGVFQKTTAAGQWWCEECTDSHEITYQVNSGVQSGHFVCESGITYLRREQTDRLKIDTAAMLRLLFVDSRVAIDPIVGERLWNIGRQTIASRSRDLLFVRGIGSQLHDEIINKLATHPKAILFTPSNASTVLWQNHVLCMVVALEQVVIQNDSGYTVDWNSIEDLFAGHIADDDVPTKSRKKRGTRTAKIEQLRDELKRHLASAADHAIATAEGEGYAALLPRPTKSELAKLAGVSKYDVTRCFADPTASELRLLWDTADNLEAVLRLRGRSALAK